MARSLQGQRSLARQRTVVLIHLCVDELEQGEGSSEPVAKVLIDTVEIRARLERFVIGGGKRLPKDLGVGPFTYPLAWPRNIREVSVFRVIHLGIEGVLVCAVRAIQANPEAVRTIGDTVVAGRRKNHIAVGRNDAPFRVWLAPNRAGIVMS